LFVDGDNNGNDDGCGNREFNCINFLRVYSKCVMPVASCSIIDHVAIYPVFKQSAHSVYRSKGKDKVHICIGTEALYRPYSP
jgi:hypothetical protein